MLHGFIMARLCKFKGMTARGVKIAIHRVGSGSVVLSFHLPVRFFAPMHLVNATLDGHPACAR